MNSGVGATAGEKQGRVSFFKVVMLLAEGSSNLISGILTPGTWIFRDLYHATQSLHNAGDDDDDDDDDACRDGLGWPAHRLKNFGM